jgi:hypothetical protein
MAYLSSRRGKRKYPFRPMRPDHFAAPFPAAKALIALQHHRSILLQKSPGLGQETFSRVKYYFYISIS